MKKEKPQMGIMVVIGQPPKKRAHGHTEKSRDDEDDDDDLVDDEDDDEDEDDEDDDDDLELEPEEKENRRVMSEAADALKGKHKKPDAAINEFIKTFGRHELNHLRSMVRPDTARAATGRLIEGPGSGLQDRVSAAAGDQKVLLSDGEFVVPADVVSMLGDGSTDAGVRVLEAMIDRVRQAKTGTDEQADELDLEVALPA